MNIPWRTNRKVAFYYIYRTRNADHSKHHSFDKRTAHNYWIATCPMDCRIELNHSWLNGTIKKWMGPLNFHKICTWTRHQVRFRACKSCLQQSCIFILFACISACSMCFAWYISLNYNVIVSIAACPHPPDVHMGQSCYMPCKVCRPYVGRHLNTTVFLKGNDNWASAWLQVSFLPLF